MLNLIQKEIIKSAYRGRAVSLDQITNLLGGSAEDVKQLIEAGYLFQADDPNLVYYFLTKKGVFISKDLLRMTKKREKGSKGYVSAKKIPFAPRAANHQLDIGTFAIKAHQRFAHLKLTDMEYLDGTRLREDIKKHASPDGWLRMGEVEVFLEIDRGTERMPAIRKKMEHYVKFHESKFSGSGRKVLILFCYTDQPTEKRIQAIKNTALEILDFKLRDDFEFVIGDMEECLNYVEQEVLPLITNQLPQSKQSIIESHGEVLQAHPGLNPYNVDYRNYVVLDESKRYYHFIDLTTPRASREATLSLLNFQIKGQSYQNRYYFVVIATDEKQIQAMKEKYPSTGQNQTITYLTRTQLNQFFQNPLPFYQ